jgi:hypothetical protein
MNNVIRIHSTTRPTCQYGTGDGEGGGGKGFGGFGERVGGCGERVGGGGERVGGKSGACNGNMVSSMSGASQRTAVTLVKLCIEALSIKLRSVAIEGSVMYTRIARKNCT